MSIYGYRRVSTVNQNTDRQLLDLNINFDEVFTDKLSGKNTNRPALQQLLSTIKAGDTLHVHSIDRLARNSMDLMQMIQKFSELNVSVIFHKEGLTVGGEDGNLISKLIMQIIGAIAEFERENINERVREGVTVAKRNDVKFGTANPNYGKNGVNVNHNRNRQAEAIKRTKPAAERIKIVAQTLGSGCTLRTVAAKLTEQGIPLPSGKVGSWAPSQVQRVCANHQIIL